MNKLLFVFVKIRGHWQDLVRLDPLFPGSVEKSRRWALFTAGMGLFLFVVSRSWREEVLLAATFSLALEVVAICMLEANFRLWRLGSGTVYRLLDMYSDRLDDEVPFSRKVRRAQIALHLAQVKFEHDGQNLLVRSIGMVEVVNPVKQARVRLKWTKRRDPGRRYAAWKLAQQLAKPRL